MNVISVPIEEIKAYENNPRKIPEEAVNALAASIKEFGFKVPVILDRDNVIVAGHTRLEAAKQLGLSEVPCVIADDLTPEQVKAFRLVDNKTGELTGWDFEKLDLELEELESFDVDMSEFGFELNAEEVDTGAFFSETEPIEKSKKDGKPHTITCPECGAEIQVDK